jgi:hypothetical protein
MRYSIRTTKVDPEKRDPYDEANRLTDAGVEYETFGNTTKMPSGDAGGHEIVSTYYVDNQVAAQKQNEQLLKYTYDPAGRAMEAISENEKTKAKATVVTHYAGSGNALTWSSEGTEKWSRNVPGIDGALDAIQTSSGSTTLQLHDLQGDIVGTVEDKETVTKLASTYNSTEFGVPQSGTTPPKYAWLGAAGVSSEPSLGSGTSTQSGASYVPQVARSLQTAPVIPPGAFPNGQGTGSQDESVIPGWYTSLSNGQSAATSAAYQKKLEEEAKKKLAEEAPPPSPGEGPVPPLGGSEGWTCEDAATTGQEVPGCEPTEGEWTTAEEAYYGGSAHAAGRGWFKSFVNAVANEASGAVQYLIDNSSINIDKQLKEAQKNWHFFVHLFNLSEDGLNCAQGAEDFGDEADEVSLAIPSPVVGKALVGVSSVLGCIKGAAFG